MTLAAAVIAGPTSGVVLANDGDTKDGAAKTVATATYTTSGTTTAASGTTAAPVGAATAEEVQELRQQLLEATKRIEQLTNAVDQLQQRLQPATTPVVATSSAASATNAAIAPAVAQESTTTKDTHQPSTIDRLIAPKSEGGQYSGAGGLYKSDRVKVGGYADFRFQTRGLDDGFEIRSNVDEENPGMTDTTNFKRNGFTTPRFIVALAAAITDKLLFNSELEFEFSGKEVEVEQMYLEYRLDPKLNFKGGVFTPPLGRFNLFHDSNLQDIQTRPLVSTFVIPATYKDAGAGILGEFKLGERSRLTYEGYVVNGLRSDEGGEIAREAGLFETKDNNRFFDNNPQKSVVGRLMFSPVLGVELGASGYRGKHDNQGQYDLSIWSGDWKVQYRDFQVLGEYARSAVQRAPESPEEIAARQYLMSLPDGDTFGTFDFFDSNVNEPVFDTPSRSSDGYYVEARYRFHPKWLLEHSADDASIAPVVRYDQVNFDRSFADFRFPLNMRRTTFGISIRPTEAATFNFAYNIDTKPDVFLRLEDGRPFPPYFTNLGANGFGFGMAWAF